MNRDGGRVKDFYGGIGGDYLRVWDGAAKKDIDGFEAAHVRRCLEGVLSGGGRARVLEIGVGPGRIAKRVLEYDVDYYGIDVSEEMIKAFKGYVGDSPKIKGLRVCDVRTEEPFGAMRYDCIIAMRMLYYNRNWKEIIKRLAMRLNGGGVLIFSMLNRYSSAILAKLLKEDVKGYYASRREILAVLKDSGFTDVKMSGYARMPDVIYDACGSNFSARLLKGLEGMLRLSMGGTYLARMYYVAARK